jgi:hypothetical protein
MTLQFPNPSRSYDETTHGVRFWGYDRTFEIEFFIENGALLKINTKTNSDEAGCLHTFDVNLERIHEMAKKLYVRRRKASYTFSFSLGKSDL